MTPFLGLLLSGGFAAPQSGAPLPPEIENEQILGIHKEPWRATAMPYASLREALKGDRYASSYAQSLNGTWKFHYVPRPEERPVDFYKPDYDVSRWDNIKVPSNWQVLGYGTPYYRNAGYTFQRDWPRVMSEPPKSFTAYNERNPVGSYRREFTVPASWAGRRVHINFDGVDAAFYLWVNGQKVGYSQNSRNVAEFDLTPYIKRGEKNTLAVEVYRYCSGSYFEDQDMWRLSGIFRNVTLWAAPESHVRDFRVVTDLDSAYKNATLDLTAKIENKGQDFGDASLSAVLYDASGKPVPTVSAAIKLSSLPASGAPNVRILIPVPNPAKWTAETPNLYTLVLTLRRGNRTEELLSTRVGFRKVEIKGRLFTINGVPVKLKGANRHEMWPETGHYVTEAQMVRDIELLKQANCNHVRTSHYSDDPRWYELCDQYGLYLVGEANAECHGYYGVLDREPRFQKMIVDRNIANVENFKNHPSVVIWSLGNECGGGSNFVAALEAVKQLDKTRPVHYEAFGIGKDNPADIDSRMYTDPGGTENIGKDDRYTKPFYLCEYAHAMNNSMGSIGDYNDVFDKYPSLMGGAIWEWQDQGLWNRRDPKRPYIAYGGGFGEEPNDGYFIHKGVVFSDRSPKPHFPEVKRAYQWIGFAPDDLQAGRIKVKNKFAFTNLKDYDFSWEVQGDGMTLAKGKLPALDLAPGQETVLTLPLPMIKPAKRTEYFLNVAASLRKDAPWAKAGYEIANGQMELPMDTGHALTAPKSTLTLVEEGGTATVQGNGFSVAFSKVEGTITALTSKDRNVLLPGGGPKLHLWRAEHRNDDGYASRDWARYGLRDLQRKVTAFSATQVGPNVVQITASVAYTGKRGFAVDHIANYTVYGDGTVAVDNSVSTFGRKFPVARIGVRMSIDKALSELTYLGRGPMENYSDRKRGSDVGLYKSTVAEQLTPYSKPMESGNHEDVRWLALGATGQPVLVAQAAQGETMQFSALPYTDEILEPTPYSVDLPASTATTLILAAKTLGVGSNACGPRPLPQYMVEASPTAFSYQLQLLPQQVGYAPGRINLSGRRFVDDNRVRLAYLALDGERRITLAGGEDKLETSFDGNTWTPYTAPFAATGTELYARSIGKEGRSVTTVFSIPEPPAAARWTAIASSFQPDEGEPENAIDGDPETYWHSRWNPKSDAPHSLTLAFKEAMTVGSIKITPRQDKENGRVKDFEVYLSDDGTTWGSPVLTGTLADSTNVQTVKLTKPGSAKFLRFVVKTDHSGGNFGAIAEIEPLP